MYADLFKRPVHFIFRVGQLIGRQMGREEFQANILQERNVSWWDVYDNNMATWLTSLILIELVTRLEGGDSCHAIVFHLFMENAKDLSKVVQNDGISLLSIIKIPNHPRF